jgi:signal transduction histidine kinase
VNGPVKSSHDRAVSIRTRLTLLYGALLVIAGAALVVIFLALFRGNYPSGPSVSRILSGTGKLSPAEVKAVRECLDLHRARDLSTMTVQSLLALAAVAAAAVAIGWAMAGRVLAPLRRITQLARRVADLHLDERISLRGPDDELKELADTFDTMLDRLDASFTAQRQFVASASHELRTPLATSRTMLEVAIAGGRVPAELRPLVDGVLETSLRSELIIDGLLTLARSNGQVLDPVPVDLSDIAAAAIEQTAHEAASAGVEVDAEPLPAVTVGDRVLLEHVALNLVRNGIRHNYPGGWLKIATAPEPGTGQAKLSVVNTGPDVPADQLDMLFEAFRRMDHDRVCGGQGVGLGLSIVRSVVGSHHGRLIAEPRPGGGLSIQVIMPANRMEQLCFSPTFAASCCGGCARRSSSRSAWHWVSAWSSP